MPSLECVCGTVLLLFVGCTQAAAGTETLSRGGHHRFVGRRRTLVGGTTFSLGVRQKSLSRLLARDENQVKNPMTALRTFGKLLLRRLPQDDTLNRELAKDIILQVFPFLSFSPFPCR